MLRDVVAIVDEQVHPFELGVACEVFGIDRSDDGLPSFDFAICASSRTPLRGPGGMRTTPTGYRRTFSHRDRDSHPYMETYRDS